MTEQVELAIVTGVVTVLLALISGWRALRAAPADASHSLGVVRPVDDGAAAAVRTH